MEDLLRVIAHVMCGLIGQVVLKMRVTQQKLDVLSFEINVLSCTINYDLLACGCMLLVNMTLLILEFSVLNHSLQREMQSDTKRL